MGSDIHWGRFSAVLAAAIIGLGGTYCALAFDVPKPLVAVSGLLFAIGATAASMLLIWLYTVITEDVRPSLRFRKPVVPLALSHNEAALAGERRFRNHPVRFWAGLILNNSFFVGFMLFDKPEHLRLLDPAHPTPGDSPCK